MIKKYIEDIKSMSRWKKFLLGIILIVVIISGFKFTIFVDNDEDGTIYGIKKGVNF